MGDEILIMAHKKNGKIDEEKLRKEMKENGMCDIDIEKAIQAIRKIRKMR